MFTDMEEMDVSFVGELFEPVTELHSLLQQLSIPCKYSKLLLNNIHFDDKNLSYQNLAVN